MWLARGGREGNGGRASPRSRTSPVTRNITRPLSVLHGPANRYISDSKVVTEYAKRVQVSPSAPAAAVFARFVVRALERMATG